MENEKTEQTNQTQSDREDVAPANAENSGAEILSEMDAPVWSVISFEKRVGKHLAYADARAMLDKLIGEKVSGLCIITDEAAEKMSKKLENNL